MCNSPRDFFIPPFDARRISRNKLHKYLIREKPDEKIVNEIDSNRSCIYQQTLNGYSSLFLAFATNREEIIQKLMSIYENDFKALTEAGYNKDCAVIIAFGSAEMKFVEEKLKKSVENVSEAKHRFLILMKEGNDSPAQVKVLTTNTDDERKIFLEIVLKLRDNATVDYDSANTYGNTLFHVVSSQRNISALTKLLEFGAAHDKVDKQGKSAFEYACINDQVHVVKWFHEKFKVDLLKFMMEGNAMFNIAGSGSFEVFEYIISEIKRFDGEEQVQEIFARKIDYHDCNVIMHAINMGQNEFAMKCLKFDFDFGLLNNAKDNILHVALRSWSNGALDLCKALIKKLPNLLVLEDSNQWTPLHLLVTRNYYEEVVDVYERYPTYKNTFFKHYVDSPTVQKTKENIWCETPGHAAFNSLIGEGHFKMAEFILDQHPDEFDSSSYISGILVTLAYHKNCIEFVKKLQKLKFFDINVPDNNKFYPLSSAALSHKNFEFFNYLLETCKINNLNAMVDPFTKCNLLHYAIWRKPSDIKGVPYRECCFLPVDVDSSDDEGERKVNSCEPILAEKCESVEIDDGERNQMFEIFMDLINRGVEVKPKEIPEKVLLHVAVDADNLEVVNELLKHDLPLDEVDKDGCNVLHYVRSAEVLKLLSMNESIIKLVNMKNKIGRTPFLTFVSLYGNDDVPQRLFDEFMKLNADVNAAENSGNAPIHSVSTEEWIKLLLDNGADINATNSQGENAVHIALGSAKWKFASFLLHHTKIDRFAVTNDEVSYIGCFTPSHTKHADIFDGELEEIFNQQIEKFINGKTLFDGAVANLFVDAGDLKIIQHPKVDLFQIGSGGQTLLHRAITVKSNIEVVKLLLEKGLDINAVTENGSTPLVLALDSGCNEAADFLIAQENVDLNAANAYGLTPLHYAARTGNIKFVCKLLLAGAATSAQDNSNETFADVFDNEFDTKLFNHYAASKK